MKARRLVMGVKMVNDSLFISRSNGIVCLCNANGQKLIITDKNLQDKPDGDIIKHYQALNVFAQTNERRC